MNLFLGNAERLLDTAVNAREPGGAVAILIAESGAIRITDATGWRLDSLAEDSGAHTVYRVSRDHNTVRVEGRSGARSCLLQTSIPTLQHLNHCPQLPRISPPGFRVDRLLA